MKKVAWLRLVNVFVMLSFCIVTLSMVLYKFIPSPLQYHEVVGEVHEISGIVFILLIVVHLSLNWNWVKAQYLKKRGKK